MGLSPTAHATAWPISSRAIWSIGRFCPDAFGTGERGSVPTATEAGPGALIEHEGHVALLLYRLQPRPMRTRSGSAMPPAPTWCIGPRTPPIRCGPDPRWYQPIDWRDPFIYRDEEAAPSPCSSQRARTRDRRSVAAASPSPPPPDLSSWPVASRFGPSRHACDGMPGTLPARRLLVSGFSRYSEQAQTIYRVSRSPHGPWETRALESPRRAPLLCRQVRHRRRTSGDLRLDARRTRERADGDWEWGGHFGSPRELISLPDGTLISRLPPAILEPMAQTCRRFGRTLGRMA